MAVVKCAIELGIAEVLERNGGSMTISELSSSLTCPQPYLYRIMRFLAHRKIFKQTKTSQGTLSYTQTLLSRQLTRMTPLILLESSPVMLAPWVSLSNRVRGGIGNDAPFQVAHGEDLWSYAAYHPSHSKLFNDAMACDSRVLVPQIIKGCPSLFDGISTMVDVGGGDGTTLSMLVVAFPWIRGINYDLPHVVSNPSIPISDRIEHVGGDMFDNIPKADVVFLKWVLHDWDDEECIQILNNCKEAIIKEKAGKVIIVEAVIEEETEDKLEDARLMLDMVMMAHTSNVADLPMEEKWISVDSEIREPWTARVKVFSRSKDVAVKVLSKDAPKQFSTEIAMFGKISHKNLVLLIGYCEEPDNLASVHEYMAGGDLTALLSGSDSLSWKTRLQIAIDSAQSQE
ncbi:hypothetical protein Cgig2_014713 [Carnegiea gigantea]|uniref:Protein kinase domain-containing protein n=1 Tax=Carnegiea gigantea TaxID=171969 RepID=A0A9Q1L1I9_9CARY|nr:hypothetical protein Cgig2_014713 [Carnegiea gigantea]